MYNSIWFLPQILIKAASFVVACPNGTNPNFHSISNIPNPEPIPPYVKERKANASWTNVGCCGHPEGGY